MSCHVMYFQIDHHEQSFRLFAYTSWYTHDNKYPWEVFIHYLDSSYRYFFCSGSLISDKHILTSAECLLRDKNNIDKVVTENDYIEADRVYVQMGHALKDKTESKQIKKIHTHGQGFVDGYNYNIGNYIILILLNMILYLNKI